MNLEQILEQLHTSLAQELLDRIRSGEATAGDLNAARQFLKDNEVYGLPAEGTSIKSLMEELPESLDNVIDFRAG